MGLFKFGKKRGVIDLTEKYRKDQEKLSQIQDSGSDDSQSRGGTVDFFSAMASSSASTSSVFPQETATDDKRKKLAKRLMDMTDKIEDLSNQIYHLQQRIEVLERKSGAGF